MATVHASPRTAYGPLNLAVIRNGNYLENDYNFILIDEPEDNCGLFYAQSRHADKPDCWACFRRGDLVFWNLQETAPMTYVPASWEKRLVIPEHLPTAGEDSPEELVEPEPEEAQVDSDEPVEIGVSKTMEWTSGASDYLDAIGFGDQTLAEGAESVARGNDRDKVYKSDVGLAAKALGRID